MRILLVGHGKMGRLTADLAEAQGHTVAGIVGSRDHESLSAAPRADVVVDFSHPDMLPELVSYVRRTGSPLCCGTTGYSGGQLELLRSLAQAAPVLYSANFSLGIAVFRRVLAEIAPALMDDFDIEMVEAHHNLKVDSPSGTANMLADAIDPHGRLSRVYGRSGQCGRRPKDELGIFSMRGGTVNGTHTVSFFGEDEVLSITHSAQSRRIFAAGALKAAALLADCEPGWYELDDLLFNEGKGI